MSETSSNAGNGTSPTPKPNFSVTDKAAKRVIDLFKRQGVEPTEGRYGIRVRVIGGGCNGMQYKMDPETKPRPGDKVFDAPLDLKVYVDLKSLIYLKGTELDANPNPLAGTFEFRNPNVKSSCGCGLSFQA